MSQNQVMGDGNPEEEERMVSLGKKELEVLMIPLVDGRINQVLKETIVPMFYRISMNSEAQDDLSSIINGFWSSRAADVAKAQRKWSMLYSVLRSKRKIAALKIVSSEAVLASKRPKIYEV
ncbi:hypothetical protein C3L33_00737, partial [Rhododendron williamsianum]